MGNSSNPLNRHFIDVQVGMRVDLQQKASAICCDALRSGEVCWRIHLQVIDCLAINCRGVLMDMPHESQPSGCECSALRCSA